MRDSVKLVKSTIAFDIESFVIDNRNHVAVANYMDEHHNIETHSTIYYYDLDEYKFIFVQNLKTFGAIDVKHVQLEENHFLIVANSFRPYGSVHNATITSNAAVYLYDHKHAKFVPTQILSFDAEVTQLLPYLVGIHNGMAWFRCTFTLFYAKFFTFSNNNNKKIREKKRNSR